MILTIRRTQSLCRVVHSSSKERIKLTFALLTTVRHQTRLSLVGDSIRYSAVRDSFVVTQSSMAASLSTSGAVASSSAASDQRPCLQSLCRMKLKKQINRKTMSPKHEYSLVHGKINHSDGSQYFGPLANGVPHGRGHFTFKNGGEYIGDYRHGKKHGQGLLRYSDCSIYEGSFNLGCKEGLGTIRFIDGSTYMGEFSRGEMEGLGTFTWPSGFTYTGAWKAGKRHGIGAMILPDGSTSDTSLWSQDLRVPKSKPASPRTVVASTVLFFPRKQRNEDVSVQGLSEEECVTAESLLQMKGAIL